MPSYTQVSSSQHSCTFDSACIRKCFTAIYTDTRCLVYICCVVFMAAPHGNTVETCVTVAVLQDGSLVVPAYMDAISQAQHVQHGMMSHLNPHMGLNPNADPQLTHGLAHSLQQEEEEQYDEDDDNDRNSEEGPENSNQGDSCQICADCIWYTQTCPAPNVLI